MQECLRSSTFQVKAAEGPVCNVGIQVPAAGQPFPLRLRLTLLHHKAKSGHSTRFLMT